MLSIAMTYDMTICKMPSRYKKNLVIAREKMRQLTSNRRANHIDPVENGVTPATPHHNNSEQLHDEFPSQTLQKSPKRETMDQMLIK